VRLVTQPMRWQGGANVPVMGYGVRMNATSPFASLSLDDSGLVLKATFKRFVLAPADVAVIYPCRGAFSYGLGIETSDGRVLIFWTTKSSAILPALQAAGFPISSDLRKVYKEIRSSRGRRIRWRLERWWK
jgi:hypothetical protein